MVLIEEFEIGAGTLLRTQGEGANYSTAVMDLTESVVVCQINSVSEAQAMREHARFKAEIEAGTRGYFETQVDEGD